MDKVGDGEGLPKAQSLQVGGPEDALVHCEGEQLAPDTCNIGVP